MKLLTILIAVTMFEQIHAGEIKARAREHVDFHNVAFNDGSDTAYRGLSNTINVWWEKPRIYSIGLAFNPIIGSAKTDDKPDVRLSRRIKLITLGLEGKYYHRYMSSHLFTRLGLGATRLDNNGPAGEADGFHAYLGAGWEFDIKGVGLALEMAYRQSRLAQGIIVNSITPSIGVHFYR